MQEKEYIYGKNAVKSSLSLDSKIKFCYLQENFSDKEILNLLKDKKINIKKVSKVYLDKLFHNGVHQGIALEVEPYEYISLDEVLKICENKKDALLVLLDGLEDPHNLGAIIRTCDAFKVDAVIIPSSKSVSVTPTVIKIATGALDYVPVCRVSNLNYTIDTLKKRNFWIVASDGEAQTNYSDLDYKMNVALIIGSEGFGISKLTLKKSDFVVKINMLGHVNSLNASVAAGVILAMINYKRTQ